MLAIVEKSQKQAGCYSERKVVRYHVYTFVKLLGCLTHEGIISS